MCRIPFANITHFWDIPCHKNEIETFQILFFIRGCPDFCYEKYSNFSDG